MKKIIFLLIAFLSQITFVFAQAKEINQKGKYGLATGGFKPNRQEIPSQPKSINLNNRSYVNDCYKNFEFTVKNYGYNKDRKDYSWGIKVKNNYTKAVSLRYKLIVGNDKTSVWAKSGTVTYSIKPGETYDNDMGTLRALIVDSNSDQYRIEVSEVCFEGQDCVKNGYVDCNGKQSNSQITQTSNSNSRVNGNNSALNMTVVDVKPEYPGGINQAYNFVGTRLKYPTEAAENNIQGTVIASFTIELDGSITDIQIVQKLGYGCDEEVIRVLQAMPKWKPGMQNGKPVRVKYSMPFRFKLSE